MGTEVTCAVTVNKRASSGRVRLETNVLHVRAEGAKLDLPFVAMEKVIARDGLLSITHPGGVLTLALADAAAKWAEKIINPPSRLAKLSVKSNWRASSIGSVDADFLADLRPAVAMLAVGRLVKD